MKAVVEGVVQNIETTEDGLKIVQLLQGGEGRSELFGVLFGSKAKTPVPAKDKPCRIEARIFKSKKGALCVFAV